MAVDDALLEACRAAPDDDAPRLVWADAIGGERGELVVIQCRLASRGLAPAEAGALLRRERELITRHGVAWSGLEDLCDVGRPLARSLVEFRRGFVEAVQLGADDLARHGEEVFRRAPLLRSLILTGVDLAGGWPATRETLLGDLRAILALPSYARLRGLQLDSRVPALAREASYFPGIDDEAVRVLVESGIVARLSALGVSLRRGGDDGVRRLIAAGGLSHLERLWLQGKPFSGEVACAVLAAAPRVSSLGLDGVMDLATIASALPPVTELSLVGGVGDEVLAALARSPAAATLEALTLGLRDRQLKRGDRLRAFPRLQALELDVHHDDAAPIVRDLAAGMSSLRRLKLRWSPYAADEIFALARALGPQLEQLEVGPVGAREDAVHALPALVAGEVDWSARGNPRLF